MFVNIFCWKMKPNCCLDVVLNQKIMTFLKKSGGHGSLYILICHGKSLPGLQLENLVFKSFPNLRDNSVFSNSSVFSSSSFWAFFIIRLHHKKFKV